MFDETIGQIEEIIMDDEFQDLQNNFMEKYWQEFDDTEENKFIYTDIHKEYTDLIERYVEQQLRLRMPDFSMADFQKQLISRKSELEGEVFEMLITFSDFLAFKEMFLDYRAEKEGRTVDLSSQLTITSMSSATADLCPDLSLSLGVSALPCNNGGDVTMEGTTPREESEEEERLSH
ncbi:hypothetical protein CAPTEDRAFT_174401 [Capitella teleta]|uniref:ADP-ribosylation factor-like protein 2-binding protein n=1 Tax=Capitella teleta TaxID=283909 RepID=R7U938_CAPTE|nr:hypothetical protein CAPTEDRAFT_174401 [Capitella teleta]|eukprot:ELU02656.1 hypothetical protein CAPTEDRAFT_174401 [Capitella teleta]